MPSFKQNIESFADKLVPGTVTACMALLSAVHFPVPYLSDVMASFALMGIYFWWVYCPGALPTWFLFLLGIVQDALTGLPLGVSALVNMSFVLVLKKERHALGQMLFVSVWIGYVALSFLAVLLQWAILSLYFGHVLLSAQQVLAPWLASCFFYPLLHWLLTRLYRKTYAL